MWCGSATAKGLVVLAFPSRNKAKAGQDEAKAMSPNYSRVDDWYPSLCYSVQQKDLRRSLWFTHLTLVAARVAPYVGLLLNGILGLAGAYLELARRNRRRLELA